MQFEPLARARISQMAYDYLRSGGADEIRCVKTGWGLIGCACRRAF